MIMAKNIANIVNFVRAADFRVDARELLDTYLQELELARSYPLPCTFLLQYDALVKPEYTAPLLDSAGDSRIEVGVWLELCRELVERAGIEWRGRPGCDWDWHVDPDMLMAYTPDERYRLIDLIMEKFREVFGYYPRSAGSWLIDSRSVEYMSEKYQLDAVCVCKEQYGTDGYTLWGGYYNQGYYPSKKNMFLPAQTKGEQVSTPVFKMLGPDPIYQYDDGFDEHYNPSALQHVMTLEPTWGCGANPDWVDWYFDTIYENESLGFAYCQTGQENSFTWKNIAPGLKMQYEKLMALVNAGKIEVMKLCDTGKWFKSKFDSTPATAMSALSDWKGEGRQSVWYDCKNYRVNWYREDGRLGIRDMFGFDENYTERYYDTPSHGNTADYDALPLLDGYRWSGNDIRAMLAFTDSAGRLLDGSITSSENAGGRLRLAFDLDGHTAEALMGETGIEIDTGAVGIELRMSVNSYADTTLSHVDAATVKYSHNGMNYFLRVDGAMFILGENSLRLIPDGTKFKVKFESRG